MSCTEGRATGNAKCRLTSYDARLVPVARPGGFEPPTGGLEVHCSIRLSYGRRPSFSQVGREKLRGDETRLERVTRIELA